MKQPESFLDWLVYVFGTGGLLIVGKDIRQWWNERRNRDAAAPEQRANAESISVSTAQQVVALVDARMHALATENTEMRASLDRLERRVDVLEDELRAHNIPIPPVV